ncbi:cellulose biosynthesis protein BcsN [Neorhizobium galegae]|nr:cellulose biosynthesis protein BcsN [Neorhizobium galegae]
MNVRDLSVLLGMAEKHLVRKQEMSGLGLLGAAVLFCGLPLLAAGCAGQPVQMGTFAKNVPAEQAMVLPPPAGPGIVSVIERRYDNAVDQDIFLYTSALTPGQNLLKAQFFGTVSPFKLSDNKLTSTPVTEAGIASEMRRALPGVRMVRSSFFVQNNYGPFGYAFGRGAGNDLCMYGWQQVRSPSGTISPLANHGSIQIRAESARRTPRNRSCWLSCTITRSPVRWITAAGTPMGNHSRSPRDSAASVHRSIRDRLQPSRSSRYCRNEPVRFIRVPRRPLSPNRLHLLRQQPCHRLCPWFRCRGRS